MQDIPVSDELCKPHPQDVQGKPQDLAVAPSVKPQDEQAIPHSIELEQALLGAILISNAAYERVSDTLRAEHFFDPLHGQIYETIGGLVAAGKLASPITLKTFFDNAEPVNPFTTVPQYLGRLAANATTTLYAADYAKQIFDLATRRALIGIGYELVQESTDTSTGEDPAKAIERAEQALYAVASTGSAPESVSLGNVLKGVVAQSMEAYRTGGIEVGLSTGFVDLDKALGGGLKPGNLIILAGRPSMGKSALAANIGFNIADRRRKVLAAKEHGHDLPNKGGIVDFNSLEMTNEEIGGRLLATEAGIPLHIITGGLFNDESQATHVIRTEQRIAATPFHIDATGGISLARLATRARRLKRRRGMDLLIIDYLQLMGTTDKKGGTRNDEITQITTGLKALAKELKIPIIALSQLSRKVEERSDKRPQLSDLRESGAIEQDADVVLFCYREEYYVERAKPSDDDLVALGDWQKKLHACTGKAEVIIGKQRHGSTGAVHMAWQGSLTRFADLAREGHLQ